MKILIVYSQASTFTGTVQEHVRSFEKFSKHEIYKFDSIWLSNADFDYSVFDCIVFHYSISIVDPRHIGEKMALALSDFQGLKVLFIQDEMRWVDQTCRKAQELGIGVIFSVVNEDVTRSIYRDAYFDNVRFETTLTGFVPEDLLTLNVPKYQDRAIDVSYRARKLPAWCGAFGQEKWIIGDRFSRDAERYGLKCDISSREQDRIYGQKWISFVSNSKAMLGAESGSSFVDFSGEVAPAIDVQERSDSPPTFEQLQETYLEGRDGDIVIHVISPRCFEAAALRTLMIMYPGEYSGILKEHTHYVSLARDHSNMDEVVEIIRDPVRAGAIIDAAYEEIACSGKWTFQSFVRHFDAVVSEEAVKLPELGDRSVTETSLRGLEAHCLRRASLRARFAVVAHDYRQKADRTVSTVAGWLPAPLDRILENAWELLSERLKRVAIRILSR